MTPLLSLAPAAGPLAAGLELWEFAVSLVVAVVGGYWTVWTWRTEKRNELEAHERKQQADERRRAALYTMPFGMAAESLQSRLYNILELGGLGALRSTYPKGEYADEMVFLVAQYFGWERCMSRYTKYAYDASFSSLVQEIRAVFATHRHGAGMRVFHNDQIELGRLVLDRYDGEYGAEFDVVGESAFARELEQHEALAAACTAAVAGLREARSVEELPDETRRRMAKLQTLLCEVLERVEAEQGVKVFRGEKRERAEEPATRPA